MDGTLIYILNLFRMWRSIPVRRLVWSLEKRLEWSVESLARRGTLRNKR